MAFANVAGTSNYASVYASYKPKAIVFVGGKARGWQQKLQDL